MIEHKTIDGQPIDGQHNVYLLQPNAAPIRAKYYDGGEVFGGHNLFEWIAEQTLKDTNLPPEQKRSLGILFSENNNADFYLDTATNTYVSLYVAPEEMQTIMEHSERDKMPECVYPFDGSDVPDFEAEYKDGESYNEAIEKGGLLPVDPFLQTLFSGITPVMPQFSFSPQSIYKEPA